MSLQYIVSTLIYRQISDLRKIGMILIAKNTPGLADLLCSAHMLLWCMSNSQSPTWGTKHRMNDFLFHWTKTIGAHRLIESSGRIVFVRLKNECLCLVNNKAAWWSNMSCYNQICYLCSKQNH